MAGDAGASPNSTALLRSISNGRNKRQTVEEETARLVGSLRSLLVIRVDEKLTDSRRGAHDVAPELLAPILREFFAA
jgi:hypothetical protein